PDLVYTPTPGFVGVDEFVYLASGGELDAEPGRARVSVTEAYDCPQRRDVGVHGGEGSEVALERGRDSPDGAAPGARGTSGAERGTLSGETAPWTYTPRPDVHGTDSLIYEALWGSDGLMTVFLTIQVEPVNDPPTVSDIPVFLLEGMPVHIKLTGEDP